MQSSLLLILFFFIPVSLFAQEFKTVHDGLEYAEVIRKLGDDPVKINLLRLELTKVRLDVHHAMDAAIGTEKTSSIAARHGAVAAINAGFFRLDKSAWAGDAAGLLQIDGELVSESHNNRIAFGVSNGARETTVLFGHLETKLTLFLGVDTSYAISGINRERKEGDLLIFSPLFGQTTLTNDSGSEFSVRSDGKDTKIGNVGPSSTGKGNTQIPPNGFTVSASEANDRQLKFFFDNLMKLVQWNVKLESRDAVASAFFSRAEDITNGVPQLIKNGKIDIPWEQEKASRSFVETRHPRTAVAKLRDGKFLMLTVDGRQPGVSVGMNLYELADYLLNLGAVDAMNLDGGGSTTMVLDGKVVNKPSDKEGERKVGDAILVTLRNKNPRRK